MVACAAGFIAARFDGADYAAALAYGNATGALATTAEGAWEAPGRDDVQALLEAEE